MLSVVNFQQVLRNSGLVKSNDLWGICSYRTVGFGLLHGELHVCAAVHWAQHCRALCGPDALIGQFARITLTKSHGESLCV